MFVRKQDDWARMQGQKGPDRLFEAIIPRYPVDLRALDREYLLQTVYDAFRPVIEERDLGYFPSPGPKYEALSAGVPDRIPLITLEVFKSESSCNFNISFFQRRDRSIKSTISWSWLCYEKGRERERRQDLRTVEDLKKAAGNFLNTIAIDKQKGDIGPIRFRTNRFLGPAEKLVRGFLRGGKSPRKSPKRSPKRHSPKRSPRR